MIRNKILNRPMHMGTNPPYHWRKKENDIYLLQTQSVQESQNLKQQVKIKIKKIKKV